MELSSTIGRNTSSTDENNVFNDHAALQGAAVQRQGMQQPACNMEGISSSRASTSKEVAVSSNRHAITGSTTHSKGEVRSSARRFHTLDEDVEEDTDGLATKEDAVAQSKTFVTEFRRWRPCLAMTLFCGVCLVLLATFSPELKPLILSSLGHTKSQQHQYRPPSPTQPSTSPQLKGPTMIPPSSPLPP